MARKTRPSLDGHEQVAQDSARSCGAEPKVALPSLIPSSAEPPGFPALLGPGVVDETELRDPVLRRPA